MIKYRALILLLCIPLFALSRSDTGSTAGNKKSDEPVVVRQQQEREVIPGMIVLKMRDDQAALTLNKTADRTQSVSLNKMIDRYNVSNIRKAFPHKKQAFKQQKTDLSKIYYFSFDAARDVKKVAEHFATDPSVLYAEPVYLYETYFSPDDPRYEDQGHFEAVQAELAWDISTGSPDVIIGIVDSGVDIDHPDLADNIWVNEDEIPDNGIDDDNNGYIDDVYGWDFVGASFDNIQPDNDPDQDNGSSHGTHVAGIAAAIGNNSTGIAGMGWEMKIMVTKNSSDTDSRSIGFGYDAIIYCADNGADIINCSWGGGGFSDFAQDVINYAYERGAVVVAAAGNDSENASYDPPDIVPPHYPSGYDHVISVAATDDSDNITGFSYYGVTVDVAAPGSSILSTIPVPQGSYGRLSGTSMASPLVAGLAGLVKSVNPDWTNDQVASQVIYTTDNIDSVFYNLRYAQAGGIGTGRVNAYRALTEEAGTAVELTSVIFDDSTSGNGNGKPEAGEEIYLRLKLRNVWGDAGDLTVSLFSDDYAVQMDDNTSFLGNISGGTNNISNSEDLISFTILEESLPHRVAFDLQISTSGGYLQERRISMAIDPMVLLVDDDDASNNVDQYYTEALDRIGVVYEIWDHVLRGTPVNVLNSYPNVIWLCEWTFPSLNQADREAITGYLQNGGKLFLSGQDIGWDLADANGAGIPNEFGRSDGDSEDFFMDWIKAEYNKDDSDFSSLIGVNGDPIGDGLRFDIFQPGRSPDNQYPDEIIPLDGAVPVFEFGNGEAGALRYEGAYKLVYFSFGGYEAITDSTVRQVVMERVLNWMNSLSQEHQVLKDTEDTENPYPVEVKISSDADEVESVELFWDTDGELPFNKLVMTDEGNGVYTSAIPAQQEGRVQYLIFAKTVAGTYLPLKINEFNVGPDELFPSIELVSLPNATSVNPFGPYLFKIRSSDNIGVDSSAAKLYYWKNEEEADSLSLGFTEKDEYLGTLTFDQSLMLGDRIDYVFSVRDNSSRANQTLSDTFSFVIDTVEYLDGFEGNLSEWDLGPGWGKSTRQNEGIYSITESPDGKYENNSNSALTYLNSYNLSPYKAAWLEYWVQYNLETDKDFIHLELSADGGESWEIIKSYTSQKRAFRFEQVFLNDYAGQDSVKLRFRLESDSTTTKDGFYLDDISFYVSFNPVTALIDNPLSVLPETFYLTQNYPNPFNPVTTVEFGIKSESRVKLEIFNMLGQKVTELTNTDYKPGRYRLQWNGTNSDGSGVASGIYIYRLEVETGSGSFQQFVRKMVLIR